MTTSPDVVAPQPVAAVSTPSRPSVLFRVPGALLDRLLGRITMGGAKHKTSPLQAPFTGETVCEVPLATPEDIQLAARRAREAQREWSRRSIEDRARVFLRFHDLVLGRQNEVLDIIQLESGKARKHAFEEVADTAIVSRYYAHHAEEHLRPKRRRGALPALTTTWEYHHPVGVVGIISPWNYPLTLAVTDAIPALMAGNAVVLKPDQQTPLTALWVARMLDEAGLPPDLFHVVTGKGRDLGTPLIQCTDFVGFTGSTTTGRTIARQAGEQLIGCSLELGGKNPMLVLASADVERAVDGAVRGCFANAGQLCISIERLYVHSSLHDRFLSRLGERTKALRLGAAFDYSADMGSLVSQDQLEKVRHHVHDATQKGATVVAGGQHRPDIGPLFFEPTVLSNVMDSMAVAQEETFGPVVSVYRFDSVEEAIEKANSTRYGLNASVWTSDLSYGRKVATRIQAGTVNINEAYAATWASVDAPMGGFKDSGLGRRHGAAGILKYTEAQTVSMQHLMPLSAPTGVTEHQYARLLSGALRVMRHIPGIR